MCSLENITCKWLQLFIYWQNIKPFMEQSSLARELESKEEDFIVSDAGNAEVVEYFERRRMESQGEETESEETQSISDRSNYLQIPYGFQSRGSYKHASKNCEIVGGRRNGSRMQRTWGCRIRGIHEGVGDRDPIILPKRV